MAGQQFNSQVNQSKSIGLMQGRLVPRWKNRYQAFPVNYWQAEFHMARELGVQFIEFILDFDKADRNPLMTKAGIGLIQDVIDESGVGVRSICADYFMEAPFHTAHQAKSEDVFKTLLEHAAMIGARDVVIPCVDQSKMKNEGEMMKVVESVNKFLPMAEKLGLLINFETDLDPQSFKKFLGYFDSPAIKVNYDIGNSASLGFSPTEEFEAYGSLISNLHVKDRVLGGSSVKLGTGNANFDEVFGLLKKTNFKGIITFQASRKPEFQGEFDYVAEQLAYARTYIEKYL